MNELTTTGQSNMTDFFDQLPTPPREKLIRYGYYAGVGLVVLGVGHTLMPYVNNLLDMVLHGVWSIAKIGAVSVGIAAGSVAFMHLWPAYVRLMESIGRRTTVWVFGEDPITPLRMWLKEVDADCVTVEKAAGDINGIVEENKQAYDDNMRDMAKYDAQFRVAVHDYGENSRQATLAAAQAGGFKDRAANAERINGPLIELYQMLSETAQATRQGADEAEIAVTTAEQEWRAAIKADEAMGVASRALNKRSSQRYANATIAFDIIRQKYAGNFGRLRSLRQLSEGAITAVTLDQGVKREEALQRLRNQTQQLIGHTPALPLPDFSGKDQHAAPVTSGAEKPALRLFDDEKQ